MCLIHPDNGGFGVAQVKTFSFLFFPMLLLQKYILSIVLNYRCLLLPVFYIAH